MQIVATAHQRASQWPSYVVTRLAEALKRRRRAIEESVVLILGVAYKENIDDTRNSPAVSIIEKLTRLGAIVQYHDLFVCALTFAGRRLDCQPGKLDDLAFYDCGVLIIA